jgi:hypothetical protein
MLWPDLNEKVLNLENVTKLAEGIRAGEGTRISHDVLRRTFVEFVEMLPDLDESNDAQSRSVAFGKSLEGIVKLEKLKSTKQTKCPGEDRNLEGAFPVFVTAMLDKLDQAVKHTEEKIKRLEESLDKQEVVYSFEEAIEGAEGSVDVDAKGSGVRR